MGPLRFSGAGLGVCRGSQGPPEHRASLCMGNPDKVVFDDWRQVGIDGAGCPEAALLSVLPLNSRKGAPAAQLGGSVG